MPCVKFMLEENPFGLEVSVCGFFGVLKWSSSSLYTRASCSDFEPVFWNPSSFVLCVPACGVYSASATEASFNGKFLGAFFFRMERKSHRSESVTL